MSVQKSTRNKMRLGQIKAILHFQESAVILIVVNGKTAKIRKVNLLQRKRHYLEHLEVSKEELEIKAKKWSNENG